MKNVKRDKSMQPHLICKKINCLLINFIQLFGSKAKKPHVDSAFVF